MTDNLSKCELKIKLLEDQLKEARKANESNMGMIVGDPIENCYDQEEGANSIRTEEEKSRS